MYHVRHRVYDASRGRWLQRDPIGLAGGVNLYQYVGNLPDEYYDPLGLWSMMRWLYTGDGNASDEVYNAALDAAAGAIPEPVTATTNAIADVMDTPTGRRVTAAVQVAVGTAVVAAGVTLGWTPAGVVLVAVGVDMIQAGARQLYTGEATSTVVYDGIYSGLRAVGVSDEDAALIAGTATAVIQAHAGITSARILWGTPAAGAAGEGGGGACSPPSSSASTPKAGSSPKYGSTPEGRPFTRHYGTETGPQRNIPGSVVDNTINTTTGIPGRNGTTIYYDPVNDVTVVTGKGGSIVSVRRGPVRLERE